MTAQVLTRNGTPEAFQRTEHRTGDAPLRWARIAGGLYLVITAAAIVAHVYVPETLIVPGDAATTASNIMASESLFRAAIGSELIILLSEIVLSVILYFIFRPVSRVLSLTAAVSRLAMTTIHGVNLLNYFFVLLLLEGQGAIAAFNAEQVNSLVALFLNAHSYGFTIGIAFLTIHVFALGYLILKSGFLPRILGVLFLLAGVGYFVDSFALLLTTTYTTTPVFLALPIALAEIAFPLWLLAKGVDVEAWKERAMESG